MDWKIMILYRARAATASTALNVFLSRSKLTCERLGMLLTFACPPNFSLQREYLGRKHPKLFPKTVEKQLWAPTAPQMHQNVFSLRKGNDTGPLHMINI